MVTMKQIAPVIALAVLACAGSCKQPGKGSYFARPGASGPSRPMRPLPQPPAPAKPPVEVDFLAQCRQPIGQAKAQVAALLRIKGVHAVDTTLELYNETLRHLSNVAAWAHLHAEVHPDGKIREAARTCEQEVQRFHAELSLDHRVYSAVKSVDVSVADAPTKRFVATSLRDFRRAGVELDDAGRARIQQIEDEITRLGQAFQQNIAEDTRWVEVRDPARLAAMPADWLAARRPDASGTIRISTDYPDYAPVMTYADDDDLRRELYVAFRSRGDARNEDVLKQVLALRAEKALLLGFKDWADYESDDKMLRGGKAAQDFIDRVHRLAARRAKQDYAELLAQLRKSAPGATEVTEWQKAYVENQVKRDKYAVDAASVRDYFAYDKVLAGLLELTATLYELEYKPIADRRSWHPDVRVFEVMRRGEKIGRIFLDMHPRPGKFKHAAQFPIVDGIKGIQLPEAALVCNFPAPGPGRPALLDHAEVVTMFHEFGHLMHHLLGGQHHWVRQSGVATERDFVEAPSQMFEEWAWRHEILARFARHHQTGEVISKELVDKMRKAERFGKGAWAVQQLFYAALSLRFHQDSPTKLDPLALLRQLQKKYTPFAYVEGTRFHTSFGHLIGYSSMYYTYLWSRVIARDLLTPFERKGLLATDVSYAYRDKILAAGGTRDAAELVRDFLGRPYNFRAFEKYLAE
jgi:thimet oligopeptidase